MGFFLSLLLVFEGLGLKFGHEISYFLIVISPFFILLFGKITGKEKNFRIPTVIAMLYAVFIFFLVISTVFSINIAQSAPGLLLYPSLFFVSVIAYNYKNETKGWIFNFLVIASLLLIAISLVGLFYPLTGFSLLYSRLNDHNNLGDFLLIPMIIGSFLVFDGKRKNIGLMILLSSVPVFLISFSRSAFTAYIAVVITMFLMLKKKSTYFYKVALMVFVLIGIFYFIPNVNLDSCCSSISKYVSHRDDIISHRNSFFLSGVRAVSDYPIFGVGFGNFGPASFRYNDLHLFWSRTSHNIFLDMATELGLPAMLAFLGVVFYAIKKSRKDMVFFVFIGLLANFQMYYSFKIYSVLFIFFILLGLMFENKRAANNSLNLDSNRLIGIFLVPIIIIQFAFVSRALINIGRYEAALVFDPFNKKLYQKIINRSISKGEYKNALFYNNLYGRVYYSDTEATEYLALLDLNYGKDREALTKYRRAMMWDPYGGDLKLRLRNLYYLTERVEGRTKALEYLESYTDKVNSMWEHRITSFKRMVLEVNNEVNPPLLK